MHRSSCQLPVLACLGVLLVLGASTALAQLPRFGFRVEEKLPLGRDNFVQGLQIVDDTLYLGTGQYGESRLREYAFPAMDLRREAILPEALFGEGVVRFEDRIYQLTWRAGQLLVYSADSLERIHTEPLDTEGWGITHDGHQLIYSDGTPTLRFLDPGSLDVEKTLTVTLGGRPLPRLNELEFIDGEVWANVWQADQIVRIDPQSGAVRSIVDLRGLLDPRDRRRDTDVLNGIAWDERNGALWVTGKRWPWLYRIRLEPMPLPPKGP